MRLDQSIYERQVRFGSLEEAERLMLARGFAQPAQDNTPGTPVTQNAQNAQPDLQLQAVHRSGGLAPSLGALLSSLFIVGSVALLLGAGLVVWNLYLEKTKKESGQEAVTKAMPLLPLTQESSVPRQRLQANAEAQALAQNVDTHQGNGGTALAARIAPLGEGEIKPLGKSGFEPLSGQRSEFWAGEAPDKPRKNQGVNVRLDYKLHSMDGGQAWIVSETDDENEPISVQVGSKLPDGSRIIALDHQSHGINTTYGEIK